MGVPRRAVWKWLSTLLAFTVVVCWWVLSAPGPLLGPGLRRVREGLPWWAATDAFICSPLLGRGLVPHHPMNLDDPEPPAIAMAAGGISRHAGR